MRSLFLAIIVVIAIAGCNENRPAIDEELYVTLLTEAALIQAAFNVNHDTLMASSIFESVLLEYDVDKNDFIESHRIYQLDLEAQERRWKLVLDTLTYQSRRLVNP